MALNLYTYHKNYAKKLLERHHTPFKNNNFCRTLEFILKKFCPYTMTKSSEVY